MKPRTVCLVLAIAFSAPMQAEDGPQRVRPKAYGTSQDSIYHVPITDFVPFDSGSGTRAGSFPWRSRGTPRAVRVPASLRDTASAGGSAADRHRGVLLQHRSESQRPAGRAAVRRLVRRDERHVSRGRGLQQHVERVRGIPVRGFDVSQLPGELLQQPAGSRRSHRQVRRLTGTRGGQPLLPPPGQPFAVDLDFNDVPHQPAVPVHRGPRRVRHHRGLRERQLLPGRTADPRQMAVFLAKALGLHWP